MLKKNHDSILLIDALAPKVLKKLFNVKYALLTHKTWAPVTL